MTASFKRAWYSQKNKDMCRRAFDLAAAVSIISVALPAAAVTALALTLETKDSPLFFQPRVGKDGVLFNIIKLRTMNSKKDFKGNLLPDIERTGFFGRIARISRIDEVPQAINVIRGQMRVVGPRPHIPAEYLFRDELRESVRPGWTGRAKISGLQFLSDQEELNIDKAEILADRNRNVFESLYSDAVIVLKTPLAVLKYYDAPHSRQIKRTLNISR